MRLGLSLLENVNSVNDFDMPSEVHITAGNTTRLYLQLQSEENYGDASTRIRWIPSSAATLSISFLYIDSNKEILNRAAVMAYPLDDRSIWYVDIGANEVIAPDSINAVLTDGLVVTKLVLFNSLRI